MRRYAAGAAVSATTTTTEELPESLSERRVRRLRLTLHAGEDENKDPKTANSEQAKKENDVSGTWKKKNGLIQRERPAGRESPQQHHSDLTNGVPETSPQHHGPRVYGVVQRMGSERQQEVAARQWTVSHLQDEMRYIREVRDSLEKVRERMYGQFGGMQQSMQKLSQEIREANTHRRTLESEVKIRTSAMETYEDMNSSLIAANISLQKSLLENCQNRVDRRDGLKSLRITCEKAQEKLREKERELSAVQAENQTLRLQVEASREAQAQVVQELTAKLQQEYEEKLREEQDKHREEIEKLQAQLDEYIRRLEEAERKIRTAEAKIAERDQRIVEVERLLDCMGKEKNQLQKKLQESEQRLLLLAMTDEPDANIAKRAKELQSETASLRERIKHLNDMVFCQQRKVKAMIEEVESLRAQVAQKDMFISELLDRIAIVECENRPQEPLETREIGRGYNQLPRICEQTPDEHPPAEHSPSPTEPTSPTTPLSPVQPTSPTQLSSSIQSSSPASPSHHPLLFLTSPTQARTFRTNNPPPSRLESSLLRYTPVEYSRMLLSSPLLSGGTLSSARPSDSEPSASPAQSGRDEVDTEMESDKQLSSEKSASTPLSSQPQSRNPLVYSPFMKLMEMTANVNTD